MNKIQKVIITVATLILIYLLFFLPTGKRTEVLTLLYKKDLVNYKCNSRDDVGLLFLKSDNNILYFDGEYFYDNHPTHNSTDVAKIVKHDTVYEGGIDPKLKSVLCLLLLILTVWLLYIPSDEGDYYYE